MNSFLLFFFLSGVSSVNTFPAVAKIDASYVVDDSNWRKLTIDAPQNVEWVLFFQAEWCSACRNFYAKDFSKFCSMNSEIINCGIVDQKKSPQLHGRFFITQFPTVVHYRNQEWQFMDVPMDYGGLNRFILDKQWQGKESIPSWRKPDSIIASTFASLAILHKKGEEVHAFLQEDLKWTDSAILFAGGVSILAVSIILGVVLFYAIVLVHYCFTRRSGETEIVVQRPGSLSDSNDSGGSMDEEDSTDENNFSSESDGASSNSPLTSEGEVKTDEDEIDEGEVTVKEADSPPPRYLLRSRGKEIEGEVGSEKVAVGVSNEESNARRRKPRRE